MQFQLSPEITDQVIFAMENQTEKMVFDTETLETLKEAALHIPIDTDRYVDIPEWDSFSGFQLMERFVAGLRNPVYRESLRIALSQGKGVFRKFKDVLKDNVEMERLWFSYKEKEMKRLVKEWYVSLRELWGCEDLEYDLEFLEETGDIIVEDFVFDTAVYDIGYDVLEKYDKTAFFEAVQDIDTVRADAVYAHRMKTLSPMEGSDSSMFIARSPAGEFAGFIWAVRQGSAVLKIAQIYVLPEFRGLGLAKTMLNEFMDEISSAGDYRFLDIELFGSGLYLSELIERHGFSLFSTNFTLNLKEWRPNGVIL